MPAFPLGGKLIGLTAQRAQWAMMRYMRQRAIAVAHAFDFYTNLMLIPAARLAGVPVIGSHRQLGDLLTRAKFKAQYWAFRLCDRVVCNSRAAAERLFAEGLPEDKVEIIPNGLAPEAFAESIPAIARKPGTVRVGARVTEVGNSSLRMDYAVDRADTPDDLCARGTSVIVLVRYATLEKVRVPDEARAVITALEKGS